MNRTKVKGPMLKTAACQPRIHADHKARKERLMGLDLPPGSEHLPIPAYLWRWNGTDLILAGVNEAAKKFAQGQITSLLRHSCSEVLPDQPLVRDALARCLREKNTVELTEFDFLTITNAERRLLSMTCTYAGHNSVIVYAVDITGSRKIARLEQRLLAIEEEVADTIGSEQHFRALIEGNCDIIAVYNNDLHVRFASSAAQAVLGYGSDEFCDFGLYDLLHPHDVVAVAHALEECRRRPGKPVYSFEKMRHKDGRWVDFECIWTDRRHDPAIGGLVLNARDITGRKMVEDQLRRTAIYDELTGLANRSLLLNHIEQAITRGKRQKSSSFAALCIDLDRFKIVNDSLGHESGDLLLVAAARKIQSCVRDVDTVARLGSDEFAVLLTDIKDVGEVTRIVERIQHELLQPITILDHEISAPVSIGVTICGALSQQQCYEEPASVLRDADTALSRAKTLGKGRSEIFDQEMQNKALTQLRIEHRLRRAVEKAQAGESEFLLHYQPILSLATGRLVGVEALARWNSPQDGLVSPADFIPIAEETGLIVPLGSWVLREACHQMRAWLSDWSSLPGQPDEDVTMSVNVSSRQFAQPHLVQHITQILEETGLEAHHLKLEITESVIMENAPSAADMLAEFRERGIRLSMDDFGTGYSSLAYLQRFPLDTLKIDRSFINNMTTDKSGLEIVRSIMSMAESLGMDVVAEGIETDDQYRKLQDLNCGYGQGYLFSKPVHGEEITTLLRAA